MHAMIPHEYVRNMHNVRLKLTLSTLVSNPTPRGKVGYCTEAGLERYDIQVFILATGGRSSRMESA